jgi:hypothetical protein
LQGKKERIAWEGVREEAVNSDYWEKESDFWRKAKQRRMGEREK